MDFPENKNSSFLEKISTKQGGNDTPGFQYSNTPNETPVLHVILPYSNTPKHQMSIS
jgi:hypothetical protein